jgi:hypothetical protein
VELMKTRQIAFLAVAGLLGMGALGVAACSSDSSSSSGALPGIDSSTGDGSSSGSSGASSSGSSGTSGGGSSGTSGSSGTTSSGGTDAGPDCGKVPTLHPTDGGVGPFCPFVTGDAGKDCPATQTCCHADNTNPETCAADPAACNVPDGGATFQCDTPLQCGAGKTCCLNGTVQSDPVCGTLFGSKIKGTACETTCAAGSVQICAQQSDCTTGTCSPFSTKGHQFGYCKP